MNGWARIGPPAAAAILLLAGGWRVASNGGEGWPMVVLGAVAFGAWLALHSRDSGHDD